MTDTYDSGPDTRAHILRVRELLHGVADELFRRAAVHDDSKLQYPEKEAFDRLTPQLKAMTYGSDEYKASLAELGEALQHHYAQNRHHPEHFGERGIRGMNLVDLVEMFCDWLAATERHADGDIYASIHKNKDRFGYGDDLETILMNTAEDIFEVPA